MLKFFIQSLKLIIVVVLCSLSTLGYAQPSLIRNPADSMYLIEIAQGLVSRGEYDEARNLLEKISAADPGNLRVQGLIEKVNAAASVTASTVTLPSSQSNSDIAADIATIQSHILSNERKNRDLEFLIRQLVQENDILAQTLAKRNRDYFELIKKVYGDGAVLPNDVPSVSSIDHTRQIMAGYQDEIVARDRQLLARNQELSHVVQEIKNVNDSLKNSDGMTADSLEREQSQPQMADELNDQLKGKRRDLIDKSITLMDKSRDLGMLQEEMTKASSVLKDADDKHAAAFKEYDVKIQNLKESWAQDKSQQQAKIYELRDQLITKTKEIKRIQNGITNQDPVLEELKEKLAQKDRKLAEVDTDILAKDKQIIELKNLLVKNTEQMAVQKNKINEQGEVIAFAGTKADDLKKRVVQIRQSLSDGDKALDELKVLIADLKERAQSAPDQAPKAAKESSAFRNNLNNVQKENSVSENELTDLRQQLNGTIQSLQEKEKIITDFRSKLNDHQKALGQKDGELLNQKKLVEGFEKQLKEMKSAEERLRSQIETSRQKMAILVDNADVFKTNATTAADRAGDLGQKAYDLEGQLQEHMTASAQEIRFLKETLSQKDKDLVELKKNLLAKEGALKLFYQKMQKATRSLNAQSLSRDLTPTPPSFEDASLLTDESAFELSWNPRDNDVYSLQARLLIATKELQFSRDQLASQDSQLNDLEVRLIAKEREWRRQKDDYTKLLMAENALQQSKKTRIADVAIKSAELESKIAKAQKDFDESHEQLEIYKKDIKQLSDDLMAKSKAMDNLMVRFEKKDQEVADVKGKLKERDEQIEFQKEAISHEAEKFTTLNKELEQSNKLVELGQNKFSGRDLSIQDLQDQVNNAQIRERGYKGQVDDMEGQLKQSYGMVKDSEQRIEDLKRQLADKEDRINSLHNDMMHLKERLRKKTKSPESLQ